MSINRNINEYFTGPHCERMEWSQPDCFEAPDEPLGVLVEAVLTLPSFELFGLQPL